jgi:4-amino-4-deoxy-L-arabinose transferase-like glycosyltransferase
MTGGPGTTQGGSTGGLLEGSQSTDSITAMLQEDADSYTWAAATVGSNSASGYQLASEQPVMAIGGFNGSDPSPTLAQFQQDVADGEIHYFIASGDGMGGGRGPSAGGSTSTAITSWVQSHFKAETVDGVTIYDLSGGVR